MFTHWIGLPLLHHRRRLGLLLRGIGVLIEALLAVHSVDHSHVRSYLAFHTLILRALHLAFLCEFLPAFLDLFHG